MWKGDNLTGGVVMLGNARRKSALSIFHSQFADDTHDITMAKHNDTAIFDGFNLWLPPQVLSMRVIIAVTGN